MNVAIKNSPFQSEVREWQRVDPNTGALMSGRMQADRWHNGNANKYGKVIDSQHISTPNGTRVQQHKEMEILQARTVSGSIQVVRSSTVQKSSSRTSMNMSNALRSSPIFAIEEVQSTLGNFDQKNLRGNSPVVTSPGGSPILGIDRGRSVSTEDLTSAFDHDQFSDDEADPRQWRRVSTIRRSLQYPKARAPQYTSRPTDLPLNIGSVSKIKRDWESNSPSSPFASRKMDFLEPATSNGVKLSVDIESPDSNKFVKKANLITTDSLAGIRERLKRLSDESLYKEDMVVTPDNPDTSMQTTLQDAPSKPQEPKAKLRDTNPADWFFRRKSYGFEEMPAQQQKSMSRMETSTDSGLGRSGEITWPPPGNSSSPTHDPKAKPRGTIITLSGILDDTNSHSPSRILINSSSPNPYHRTVTYRSAPSSTTSADPKRHSIAVDESKYVRESNIDNNDKNAVDDQSRRPSRRVEFCKTEVHFAAESGRVNIVETDGKPPSTNNFRRRRRSSTTFDSTATSAAGTVLMHFGDTERQSLTDTDGTTILNAFDQNQVRVTVVDQQVSPHTNADQHHVEEEENSDEISLRGILKNKPVKPKPYHLGENLENTERLWGVRLKPVVVPSGGKDSPDMVDNKEISLGYSDRKNDFIERERTDHSETRNMTGFATKVNLQLYSKPEPRSWMNNDANSHHQHFHHHSDSQTKAEIRTATAIINVRLDDLDQPPHSAPNLSTSGSSNLKSTSLIMQTIKTKWDEAQIPATLHDNQTDPSSKSDSCDTTFAHSTTRSSSLAKTSSTSSIQSDGILFNISNLVSNSSSASSISIAQMDPPPLIGNSNKPLSYNADGKPIAAPRIKKIAGSSAIDGLSHQLSQLRRIYEAAELDSLENELVDNEVQLYLGSGGDEEEKEAEPRVDKASTEVSGSWSRVRAQRIMLEQKETASHTHSTQNSNRLSILLHSPVESTKTFEPQPTAKPIAMPRSNREIHAAPIASNSPPRLVHTTVHPITSPSTRSNAKRPQSLDLKPINGARKLREHELSYFGLNVATSNVIQSHNDASTVVSSGNHFNRHQGNQGPHSARQHTVRHVAEGKLFSDKPDLLLNHSPPKPIQNGKALSSARNDEARRRHRAVSVDSDGSGGAAPIYENVLPSIGKRQQQQNNRDVERQRDEQNLRELMDGANDIKKSIKKTDDASDRPRNQSTQSSFDTIREEGPTAGQTPRTMLSKGVQVSRGYNHTLHRIKPLRRNSSASSSESITSMGRSQRSPVTPEPRLRSCSRSHRVLSSDEGEHSHVRWNRMGSTRSNEKYEKMLRSSVVSSKRATDPTIEEKKSRKSTSSSSKDRAKTATTITVAASPSSQRKPHHVVVVRTANIPLITSSSAANNSPSASKKSSSSSRQRDIHAKAYH